MKPNLLLKAAWGLAKGNKRLALIVLMAAALATLSNSYVKLREDYAALLARPPEVKTVEKVVTLKGPTIVREKIVRVEVAGPTITEERTIETAPETIYIDRESASRPVFPPSKCHGRVAGLSYFDNKFLLDVGYDWGNLRAFVGSPVQNRGDEFYGGMQFRF
jgi:hypothetical protein